MKKPKARPQISLLDEIIVDNFAGDRGASTGIELAAGRRALDEEHGTKVVFR